MIPSNPNLKWYAYIRKLGLCCARFDRPFFSIIDRNYPQYGHPTLVSPVHDELVSSYSEKELEIIADVFE